MSRTFELPDLGEGIAEGEVIAWRVEVGDFVSEEDPLIEVETDKALVEIPSPITGRVRELHVEEGEIVPVGIELLTFDEANGEPAAEPRTAAESEPDPPRRKPGFARPSIRRLARELGVDLSRVDGSGPAGRIVEEDVRAAADSAAAEPEAVDEPETDSVEPATPSERRRTLATPAVRRLATELEVDIEAVPASAERDGQAVVTADDVRSFVKGEEAPIADVAASERREPYRGVRRVIGQRMTEAWETIPHATHHDEVDATRLVELRASLTSIAEERELRLTYLPFVMLAVARALEAHPILNAALDEEAEEIVYKQEYNIGFATDTEAGLVVPVVREVDRKGLFELAREIEQLGTSARDRSIDLSDLRGGTFTISNIGGIGGYYATPIVNPPEVGILALGAIDERPRVVDGEIVPRKILPLSLSIDHRVVDGADAARFTNEVKKYLARPARTLVD